MAAKHLSQENEEAVIPYICMRLQYISKCCLIPEKDKEQVESALFKVLFAKIKELGLTNKSLKT